MVSSWGHSGTSRSGALWGSSFPFLPDKERKLCAHPRLEIYQQDQIYFMCPLARQGDFYVPEVKETERKSRGPAEASDTQVDDTGTEGGERGRPAWSPLSGCAGRGRGGSSWLGCTVGVQCPPQDSKAELPIPRHVGPRVCGFVHVTPGDTDAKILPGFPSEAAGVVPLGTQITDSWVLVVGGD